MVVRVAIKVFHAVGSRCALQLAWATATIVVGIVNKLQIVEALASLVVCFVGPEVVVEVACHHHCSLSASVYLASALGIFGWRYAESLLQVYRRTVISAPAIAKFIETHHGQVALQGVLYGPNAGVGRPHPCEKELSIHGVLQTECICIVRHQRASAVVYHVFGIRCGLFQVVCVALSVAISIHATFG